jgi:hypothetical protein
MVKACVRLAVVTGICRYRYVYILCIYLPSYGGVNDLGEGGRGVEEEDEGASLC